MCAKTTRSILKKRLNIWTWMGLILACALLLLSQFAGIFDPRPFWIVAFIGLAYPFILVGNVIFAFFLALDKNIYICIPLIVIALGVWEFRSIYSFSSANEISIGKVPSDIRVLSYNVHSFKRYGEEHEFNTRTKILDIIRLQNPDIVCFQEFYTRKRGSFAMMDSVQRILATKYSFFYPKIENSYEAMGLAIISKYPIVDKGNIDFMKKNLNGCIWVDIKKGDKVIRVYNLHLASIGFKKQDYSYLNGLDMEGESTSSSSKRILKRIKRAFQRRSRQVHLVDKYINECSHPYILAGDFNDTPNSFAVSRLSSGLNNSFVQKGSGLGGTYYGFLLDLQIDYILSTKHFWTRNYVVINQKLSDHYAIRSDLALQN